MAKKAGVTLTPAGAAFPMERIGGQKHTYSALLSSLQEIEQAAGLFTLCVKLVTVRKMLEQTESWSRSSQGKKRLTRQLRTQRRRLRARQDMTAEDKKKG